MGENFDCQIILKCNVIHINPKFKNKWYTFINNYRQIWHIAEEYQIIH